MTLFMLPWLEIAAVIPAAGAALIGSTRGRPFAARTAFVATSLALAATLLAMASYGLANDGEVPDIVGGWAGRPVFRLDRLSGPLPVLVAVLHSITALATARVTWSRASFAAILAMESIQLAVVSCVDPWTLVALLSLGAVPPAVKMVAQGKPARVFIMHMAAFAALLAGGWAGMEAGAAWAPAVVAVAVLLRSGCFPGHLWALELFEHASLGTALLFVAPLSGVYAAARLLLPTAPDAVLNAVGLVALVTTLHAAGMATVQRDMRRFFAYLFLSHAALVMGGLEAQSATSLTGGLTLWVSVAVSLGGLCLTLRAVEARFGRLPLAPHHGLYAQTPLVAVGFLLTGLAAVGFPGMLGFVAAELLITGLMPVDPVVAVGLTVATAINGIAIVRAYLLIFTGKNRPAAPRMDGTPRERGVILAVVAALLILGLWPRPLVNDRHAAAAEILARRLSPPAQHEPQGHVSD